MLYTMLRAAAGIALRWFYGRVDVEGLEHVPPSAPLLVVVNHPNALVDALLVGWIMPRRIVLTAKATLFQNPLLAALLRWVGVVPLVRSSDARATAPRGTVDPRRNEQAFSAIRGVLRRGGTVVVFPEGISHDNPSLAPLRTGAARMALDARAHQVADLQILPIGLTFERKDAPRTRVLVRVGTPIAIDHFAAPGDAVAALTAEIEARLRRVTVNYASPDDASRASALARLFAAILRDDPGSVGARPPLSIEVSLASRIDRVRDALTRINDDRLRARVDVLVHDLAAFDESLHRHRVSLEDVSVSSAARYAPGFVVREAAIALVAGPLAAWGAVNHWVPFHAARAIARRSVESAADPAMRTIVAGTALVLGFYGLQGMDVKALAGWVPAALYVASLPLAAEVNFMLSHRRRRAVRRARTYLLFRRRPRLRARLQTELLRLRGEALEIEELVLREVPKQAAV